jgi:hypothetical protein
MLIFSPTIPESSGHVGAAPDSTPGQPGAQPGVAPAHSGVTRPLKGQALPCTLHSPTPPARVRVCVAATSRPHSRRQPPPLLLPAAPTAAASRPHLRRLRPHPHPHSSLEARARLLRHDLGCPPTKVMLVALLCQVRARRSMSSTLGNLLVLPPPRFLLIAPHSCEIEVSRVSLAFSWSPPIFLSSMVSPSMLYTLPML